MALTVTEASAVNDLLDYVYGRADLAGRRTTLQDAHTAAQLLADHAYKTLMAGVRGSDLRLERLAPPGG